MSWRIEQAMQRRNPPSGIRPPFGAAILDVITRAEMTARKQAYVLAEMFAEYTENVRAETVQACADVARGWDPIEAALAGSAVAADIADAIVDRVLNRG